MPNDALRAAARTLDIQPRPRRWRSLSFCIVEAVWSVGSKYRTVVVPLAESVAAELTDASPYCEPDAPLADPVPLDTFLHRFPNSDALQAVVRNNQRTSTKGGILKSEAVIQYAMTLQEHGLVTLEEVAGASEKDLATADAALRKVPGDGSHGIRRGYLWMLTGRDDLVKPDRRIMRWLRANGFEGDPQAARATLHALSQELSTADRPVSPWMLDNAIWRAAGTL